MVAESFFHAEMHAHGWHARVAEDATGLQLRVRREDRARLTVRLGITVDGRPLASESRFLRSSSRRVEERLQPRSGKTTMPREREHEELTATFAGADGLEWAAVVRLAEDGVALRYEIPDLQGVGILEAETTAIELGDYERAWLLDYQTWYETPRFGCDIGDLLAGDYGFPILLKGADDTHVLVTESGIDGRRSGAHGVIDAGTTSLAFRQADAAVEIARGPVTPWRVFLLGKMAQIVESTFVDELAPTQHPTVGDAEWVRPGRAAWSWWSDFYSGAQLDHQKHFVDLAARLGWEHLLIDCGWEETWVPEIVAYASRFGIQVHLWAVWHDLDGPEKLERLALWRSWGVAGIKVDFMESESKDRYRWYDTILQETARLRMMVNFHGSVIPRGWARTWPQVVGYEAIRGSEYYVFYNDTPLTAAHNVIQPFTRNVVGAMDYTPVAFTAPGRTTSDGHELALSVAFECGITHFADSVDAYLERPIAAGFLAELAPVWDETLLLAGSPDTEAVIARRAGDRWFVGAIAAGGARTIDIPLERLGEGPFDAWIATDAADGSGHGLTELSAAGVRALSVPVSRDGGFVAVIAEEGGRLFRAEQVVPVSEPTVEHTVVELDEDGTALIFVPDAHGLRVAPGWQAASIAPGRWRVTAPHDLSPGALGVVTVEAAGLRGVPSVTHVRLMRPLTGMRSLSELPMIAFRNESGPVERDMSNGGGNPRDGRRLSIAGVEFDIGLGMSSPGEASFHLGGRAERLTGAVGVDEETDSTAAVVTVEADGELLFTGDVAAGVPAISFDVELRGRSVLTLRTAPRTGSAAHIDWVDTQLIAHSR